MKFEPTNGLNSPRKLRLEYVALVCGAVVGAIILALNLFTVTPAGQTKVQTCFGHVTEVPFKEGLHFPVNPICRFDTYDTRQTMYEQNGINIPTQDRFNSTANVTVLLRIPANATPGIRTNFGTAEEFIDKTLRQVLRSLVRDEGRKLKDSRALAMSDKVSNMQESIKRRLTKAMDGKLIIDDVLIQNIVFDKRIASQILKTQERIQREESEASQLRIEKITAQKRIEYQRGKTESQRLQTDADAYKVLQQAKAVAESKRQAADAEKYALIQQAEGNLKLNKSLTPNILKLKELEVRQIEAGKGWNGNLPDNYSPIFGDGSKESNQPFILKSLK